ncbi:hypothetical protein CPAV1605_659 [seawater metagenome]|uniref:Uncharacterized protein n=1 Tax=seawater metagenome TaxID=1561972 RepID=A0A5E8CJW2_9ZZZZ
MSEISEVVNLTRETFDLYNKAILLFNTAEYNNSCNLFGQVIFNLYSIKKNLLNSPVETPEKTLIFNKIKELLNKSFDYARELDMMDFENEDSEEKQSIDFLSSEYNDKVKLNDILTFAFEGDILKIQEVIQKYSKLDLNITNSVGETPLHIAVRNGDTRMTELLLKAGANINNVTIYGLTPIEISCVNKDFKMISLLQDYGCKLEKLITIRDNNNDPTTLKSNKINIIVSLKKLLQLISPLTISKSDSFFKIKEYVVQASLASKKKVKILNIIDSIEKSESKIGWDDYLESDVFNLVWNAIFSNHFINSSKDIIKILIEEIYYSSNQKNLLVCPSTKYERIIYCLAGFRPDIFEINMESVLNQELIMYSLNYRNQLLEKKDQKFSDTYKSSIHTEEQIEQIDNFNEYFKKELMNKLDLIYVQPGILKKKELSMILNKWINII